jgi:hypothetical protein
MRSSGGVTSFRNWVINGITSPIKAISAGLGAIGGLAVDIVVVSFALLFWACRSEGMEVRMTPRQAGNILTWWVLVPITIIVWTCVLALLQRDPAPKFQARLPHESPPPMFQARPPPSRYACPIAAQCSPVPGVLSRPN